MKAKAILTAAAIATAGLGAAEAASAQSYRAHYGWQPINARLANLDHRIDVGVRNGALTRREASGLRAEFNGLLRLEANYRRGGLTAWERSDLDRRFDRLAQRIRYERRDHQDRRGRW